jgi:hypothetical protein
MKNMELSSVLVCQIPLFYIDVFNVVQGPNKLSILSGDAYHTIYASAKSFDKSLAYRFGHSPDGGLFFLRNKDEHSIRRKSWAPAFNPIRFSSFNVAKCC